MKSAQVTPVLSGSSPRSPILLMRPIRWASGLLRSLAGTVRHAPEVLLHSSRRAAARQRIARARPVRSVLVLCHGNVCRSPFAEASLARMMAGSALTATVSSAGFIGPGRLPPPEAQAAAARRGVDVSAHRSVVVTQPALDAADMIVVMTASQEQALRTRAHPIRGVVVVLGDLDPLPVRRRTIRDPWGCDESVFDASFERIDRCLAELKELLGDQSDFPPPATA
jgi:protein-tyrosine phosphatase